MKKLIFIFILFTLSTLVFGQIHQYYKKGGYSQHNYVFNSEKYEFGEMKDPNDTYLGRGTYKETKRKIILYYEMPLKDTIKYTFNEKHRIHPTNYTSKVPGNKSCNLLQG